jgi:mono/diheme cytochrome c family protein
VTQHFTKTLKRRPGKDFRLPTDHELDAMEAFQLSLGRQSELNLSALQLRPAGSSAPDPEDGKRLFTTSAKCSVCHSNAGANAAFAPVNSNFNTGVEDAPHPAQGSRQPRPRDGGFGTAPNAAGGYGDGTFNTPTLVEAADTGPFFHNNAVATIEDAVRFYTTTAFSNSPAASGRFGTGPIVLTTQEIANVAAFLRTINALENIRSAQEYAAKSRSASHFGGAKRLLSLAIAETHDAIKVLQGARLYPGAVRELKEAREKLTEASRAPFYSIRSRLIDRAVAYETSAKALIAE